MPASHRLLKFALLLTLAVSLTATSVVASIAASAPGQPASVAMSFQDGGALPASVTIDGVQYLVDRSVPLDPAGLEAAGARDGVLFLRRPGDGPGSPVYGQATAQPDADLVRYLSTNVATPDQLCLAETAAFGPLTAGDTNYLSAGLETDIPATDLEQIADAGGQFVYADPGATQPASDLFLETTDGLFRFVRSNGQGRPITLPDTLPFAGQTYAFQGDATAEIDPATLAKFGCAGVFPVFGAAGQAAESLTEVFVLAGGRYFRLTATGPAADDTVALDQTGQTDEGTTEEEPATPEQPAETPAVEATTPPDEESPTQGELLPLEVTVGAAGANQPSEYPREVLIDGQRYVFDRLLPLDRTTLSPVAQSGEIVAFARSDGAPLDALFLAVPDRPEPEVGRYLPEQVQAPEISCVAEATGYQQLTAGDATYVAVGFERDLTPDMLQIVYDAGGVPVYADPGTSQPYAELFYDDGSGLARYLLLTPDGLPEGMATSLVFAGEQFDFTQDATGSVDPAQLVKVGCAGPFPLLSTTGDMASGQLFLDTGNNLFQFGGDGVPAETPTATPTLEPTATETATLEPTATETATQEPTATETPTPTETPEPTATATLEPSTATATPEPPTATATLEAPTATVTLGPSATATTGAADEPTATPTATIAPTQTATHAPTATGTPIPSQQAGLPQHISVQNTTYIFNQVTTEVDITNLVQVDVILEQGVQLFVYAEQDFEGATQVLYCVTSAGEPVGEYVLQAGAEPASPPTLPQEITIENTIFVFNEVDITINVQTLVQVDFIIYQNTSLTVYAEQSSVDDLTRLWLVAPGGVVIGQYVQVVLVIDVLQPLPTVQPTVAFQPPAVVPTLPPSALPPAAGTGVAVGCLGSVGPLNALNIPANLPNRLQWGGIAYNFAGTEPASEAGALTRLGCAGPFEVASSDLEEQSQVLYLRIPGSGASQLVYRFEASLTFVVVLEIQGDASNVQVGDDRYRLAGTWQPVVYGSVSVLLFQEDPESTTPGVIYGVDVSQTVVGNVIGEYRPAAEGEGASADIVAAASETALNPDLTINGQRYLLAAIHQPIGTTTNGFLTLFAPDQEGTAQVILGRDKRETGLFIYELVLQSVGG